MNNTDLSQVVTIQDVESILTEVFAKEILSNEFRHEYTKERRVKTIESFLISLKAIHKITSSV